MVHDVDFKAELLPRSLDAFVGFNDGGWEGGGSGTATGAHCGLVCVKYFESDRVPPSVAFGTNRT